MDGGTPIAKPFCIMPGCNNDALDDRIYCADHIRDAPDADPSFYEFMAEVRVLIESKAEDKGYNESGSDSNPLMEFDLKFFPGHAAGEVLYKLVRYQAKRDKTDLTKAAAWLYLIWRHDKCVR